MEWFTILAKPSTDGHLKAGNKPVPLFLYTYLKLDVQSYKEYSGDALPVLRHQRMSSGPGVNIDPWTTLFSSTSQWARRNRSSCPCGTVADPVEWLIQM
jgi:hypothetical protein